MDDALAKCLIQRHNGPISCDVYASPLPIMEFQS